MAAAIITKLVWSSGSDRTDRGWWYEVDRECDLLESGTLGPNSDREQVLEAIARKLHVDEAVEV
jgi:hypothetical protein